MSDENITQQEFLKKVMSALGLERDDFAVRINVPVDTLKKWMRPVEAVGNYREMPSSMWAFLREILAHEALKRKLDKLKKSA